MKRTFIILVAAVLGASFVIVDAQARNKYARKRKTPSQERSAEVRKEQPEAPLRLQSIDYERVLEAHRDPLIEDHYWYFKGEKLLHRGKPKKAERYFRDIIAFHPESVWARDAKLKLAEALIEGGTPADAVGLVDGILRKPLHRYEAFEARLLKARAVLGSGSCEAAVQQFKFVAQSAAEEAELAEVTNYFGDVRTKCGANLASWIKSPSVQYRICESFFEASQWDEAAQRVRSHVLGKSPSHDLRQRAEFLLGKALARTHHYDEAVMLFEKLRKGGGHFPGLSYWLARTYAKEDRYDKAIAIRRSLAKSYGRSRSAASYLSKVAFLLLDQGKYEESRDEWENVISMGLRGENLMYARWYLAWCNYRLKKYDAAISGFDWILAHNAKRYRFRDRARYWKARALIESGRSAEGRSLLAQISGRSNYYGEMARRRLNGDKRTEKNFARSSRRGYAGSASHPHVPSPASLRGQSIHLARAVMLDEIGLDDLAAREVRAAEKTSGVDSMVLLEIARRSGAHDVGRRIAIKRHYSVLQSFPHGGTNRFIWEQAYPQAYRSIVADRTNGSPVDEDLVWSIMKAESNFRPEVVSPAGAVGLMQLMPSTARSMNRGGGSSDSRMLFKPQVNIDYGTRYLKERLWPLFPGDYVSIIASYNAGEEAVSRWLRNKPLREDIELFVEEIPYKETQLYVRRVLSNYWAMQRLYD